MQEKYHALQPYTQFNTLNHTQLWVGIDSITQQKVMIKYLQNGFTPIQFSHFFQEYQIYQRLNRLADMQKSYFLPLFEAKMGEDENYLAFKWCQGTTLKQCMTANNLAFSQKIACLIQLCNAVEILHAQGIIHGDIKPSNIFMCQPHLKLLDFGLAQPIKASTACRTLTSGTPAYMSPEQFIGQPVGQASDYYSVGVVMYELLYGEKPFYATTLADWAIAHCQTAVPAIRPLSQQSLPKLTNNFQLLAEHITALLAKFPQHRPLTLQPVIKQLRALAL